MSTLIVGCGYLGERVGKRLVDGGESVWGVVRSAARADALAGQGIEPIQADVLEPATLQRLPSVERVFYAVSHSRAEGASQIEKVVKGLENMLSAVRRSVRRVVVASTTGVYDQAGGEWVDELTQVDPQTESGRAHRAGEHVLASWAAWRSDVRAVVVRYAGLYGPGRVVRRAAIERGEPIVGDPERFLNLIEIDDAASAAVSALQIAEPLPLYLAADDQPVPRRVYYELAARLLGASRPRLIAPLPGSAEADRDRSNKRIANRLMKQHLGVRLQYPDITCGLPHALGIQSQGAGSI